MSQPMPPPGYTPQYTFWPQYLTPPEQLLGPARRAGLMLIVLGVLTLLIAGCGGLGISQAPMSAFEDAARQARQSNPNNAEVAAQLTPQLMKTVMVVGLGVVAGIAVLLIALGAVVRLGGMVAPILALIVVGGCALLLALGVLSSLVSGAQAFAMSLIVFGLPLMLCIVAGIFLIQALVAAPRITEAQRQMQLYHQQQQMAYYQQNYQQPPT